MMFKINWHNTLDSTNSEALRRFNEFDDFTVVASKFQTAGRGQRGTSWESDSGKNLTFSLILKSHSIKADKQFIIAQIVTVGIKRYLKSRGIDAKIKWPNDIYIGNKKVCGILIEHFLSGDTLSGSVVGVGLNLNQDKFNSDAPNPISMKNILKKELNMEDELEALAGYIYELYFPFVNYSSNSTITKLDTEYYNSLYRLEEFHKYHDTIKDEIITARITGIDNNACLLLEKEDGSIQRYSFKEVKYIL